MNLQKIAGELTSRYHWNICDFGRKDHDKEWAFTYLIKAILVSGGSDDSSEIAVKAIQRRYSNIAAIAEANYSEMTELLAPTGIRFHPRKAKQIVEIAKKILPLKYVPDDREQLESYDGVGRHVASVVLATVFGEPEFAIDVHVRRILSRMGFIGGKASEISIETLVSKSVDDSKIGHFSRALVDFGQSICGSTPLCHMCPFRMECPAVGHVAKSSVISISKNNQAVNIASSNNPTKQYIVQFKNGVPSCNCIANRRFKKQCSHIAEALKGMK